MTVDADQKDLYEDLDYLMSDLPRATTAGVLIRVLEALTNAGFSDAGSHARETVRRWLRDQANARIKQKMIDDEPVTLEEYEKVQNMITRPAKSGRAFVKDDGRHRMYINELTGKTWYE